MSEQPLKRQRTEGGVASSCTIVFSSSPFPVLVVSHKRVWTNDAFEKQFGGSITLENWKEKVFCSNELQDLSIEEPFYKMMYINVSYYYIAYIDLL
jgi:hypothetical protein